MMIRTPSPVSAKTRIVASLALLCLLATGRASAQIGPEAPPASLRLTQVVPRLPIIHIYAVTQDQNGTPVALQPGEVSVLVGANSIPADVRKAEGIAIVFLVDVSLSLSTQQFALIKAAVQTWIDSMGPDDRAAMVTLGSNVRVIQDFTDDKLALSSALRPLEPHDQQTLLYQGLVQAIDLSRRIDKDLPLRRAIVTLTDGMDDQKGGAGRQEVLDKLALDPTPIYGIGVSAKNNAKVDQALKEFAGLVRASGGDFRPVNRQNLDKGYADLRRIMEAGQHLTATCPTSDCRPDGAAAIVRLLLSHGSERLTSESVTVRLVGADGRSPPRPQTPPPVLIQTPPAPVPAPAPATVQAPATVPVPVPPSAPVQQVEAEPKASSSPSKNSGWSFNVDFKFFLNAPMAALLALLLGGTGYGVTTLVINHNHRKSDKPLTGEPSDPQSETTDVSVSGRVAVAPGTQQDKRRLRLFPLGHNDLGPIDVLFQDKLTLGRSPDSDICIGNDAQVSALHCTLSPKGHLILVEDDGSRNGTRVNGVPVSRSLHAEADSILGVGRTELRVRVVEAGTT
jgi:Mg-chelatase subunit ChlD